MKYIRKSVILILLASILFWFGCTPKKTGRTVLSLDEIFGEIDDVDLFFGNDASIVSLQNRLFESFSHIEGSTPLVYKFGNEATYFEWVAEKILFTSDTVYKEELKQKIREYPQTETGYLWSWTTSTWWPTGEGDMHYDGIFRYVSAVADIVRYENSSSFLEASCTSGSTGGLNAAYGKTVYQKCDLAINYAIRYLHGEDGVIHLTEDSMYLLDGITRIDEKNGRFLWNNTGKANSSSSNYWDNHCFGGYDAYETMLFYHALQDMADIETLYGYPQKAREYKRLGDLVHQKFDEYFWNEESGRYIDCIDEDGNEIDFGFTFLNTEALSYGLGNAEKADCIFSWLDGTRIVSGDTVTGKEIFDYTRILNSDKKWYNIVKKEFYLAPVSNTKAIESRQTDEGYWWNDLEGNITVDAQSGNASYGHHLENGGYIFYTVYYEFLARAKYQTADKIAERYAQIAEVYDYNRLNSDVGGWIEGLCGEFPESGLNYMSFLYALMGVDVRLGTLCITPNLPETCSLLGVREFCYASQTLTVMTAKNGFAVQAREGTLSVPLSFRSAPEKTYTVRTYIAEGVLLNETEQSFREESVVSLSYENDAKTVVVSW